MNKVNIAFICIITEISVCVAQNNQFLCYYKDKGKYPRERLVDYEHIFLDLKFDTLESKVYGNVTHYFRVLRSNIDSLILDAVDINVKSVTYNENDTNVNKQGNNKSSKPVVLKYKSTNNLLIVYLNQKIPKDTKSSINITYECKPKRGLYFIGWNDSLKASRKQIWTQGQGIDNRHWIPMFDDMSDKITTDIRIQFNKKYQVISNGVLVERKELKNGIFEWRYKMNKPHAPYLIMLAIGDYKAKKFKSKSGIDITAYYYPDKEYCVDTTFRYSAEMMDFLETEIGVKYPWDKYSVIPVQEYMYGAMENTTATIFGDFLLIDEYAINDRDFLPVAAHELAHQWFGDYVTAYSSAHIWLQESFATYYNWLVEKAYFGDEHYDWQRKSVTENILKESEKNLNPIAHSEASTVRLYSKGAYVLHMLKYVIGKELYDASIKRYLLEHPYQNVESNDLIMAIYKETGMYLDWFFDEWIYKGGEPNYVINFEEVEQNNKKIGIFYVKQIQLFKDNVYLFKMPIVFEIHFEDGSFISKTEWIDEKDEVVKIEFEKAKKISYVLFDPNSNILKNSTFEKPFEMLMKQASKAPNMLDRYDAILSMKNVELEKKRAFLQERYWQETFHAIKSEIVKQLINDTLNIESIRIIKDALLKAHPLVNRTVIENTKKIPSSLKEEFFNALNTTKSYINIEKLMWLLYDNYPREYPRLISIANKFKPNDRNVEITALAIDYLCSKNKQALEKIVLYSSPSFEFRTRNNAFNALIKINYFDERIRKYLNQASNSPNHRLSNVAKETLNYFEKQKR